jgi:hypothetical protein
MTAREYHRQSRLRRDETDQRNLRIKTGTFSIRTLSRTAPTGRSGRSARVEGGEGPPRSGVAGQLVAQAVQSRARGAGKAEEPRDGVPDLGR